METVEKVLRKCTLVQEILSTCKDIRDEWYASDDFREQLEVLYANLDEYAEKMRSLQLPVGQNVMRRLEKADWTLERVQRRIRNLQESQENYYSRAWWLFENWAMMVFPGKLEKTITKLQDAVDRPKFLQKQLMNNEQIRRYENGLRNELIILDDGFYVPIKNSENKVIQELERSNGLPVVLLHGEAGKGKSILGRRVYALYGKDGEKRKMFDHVLYVICGDSPDPITKMFEILQSLDPDSLASSPKEGPNSTSKDRIAHALKIILSEKKILMILDDVSDNHLLRELQELQKRDVVKPGKNTKCLVISQSSSFYSGTNVSIEIRDPDYHEAKMILASLAGLIKVSSGGRRELCIPHDLQVAMEKIIKITQRNPLALACVAKNFSDEDKQDKRTWQEVYNALHEGQILSNDALKTAIKLSLLDSLETSDAKVILYLLYACKRKSVPEEVLEILHAPMRTSWDSFNISKNELYRRGPLKSSTGNLAPKDEKFQNSISWSLGSLVTQHIGTGKVGRDEFKSLVGRLQGNSADASSSSGEPVGKTGGPQKKKKKKQGSGNVKESEGKMVEIALCAVYFDRTHRDSYVSSAAKWAREKCTPREKRNLYLEESTNGLRRNAIEPIVWLLGQPEDNDQWKAENMSCARQIFLKYVSVCQLDGDNISELLKVTGYPSAPLATLEAITRICYIEDESLLTEETLPKGITFLTPILDLCKKTGMQEAASRALRAISWKAAKENSTSLILKDALNLLVNSIQDPGPNHTRLSDALAVHSAATLANLAWKEDPEGRSILDPAGALASLVKSLSKDDNPGLQEFAAEALSNLARGENSVRRITNDKGVLAGLVKSLSKDNHPRLQEFAAGALESLANVDHSIGQSIANEKGALAGLVKLLYKDDNSRLQEFAARTLQTLAKLHSSSICRSIANEKGALAGLVKSLDKNNLQDFAAGALERLANVDDSIRRRIVNERGALAVLVKSLSNNGNSQLQELAAKALSNLARGENSIKLRIVNEKGALAHLVKLLEHEGENVPDAAALALATLSQADHRIKFKIVQEEGVLTGLVTALFEHSKPAVRSFALSALYDLAGTENYLIREKMVAEEGLVAGLENLTQNIASELHETAKQILDMLDRSTEDVRNPEEMGGNLEEREETRV